MGTFEMGSNYSLAVFIVSSVKFYMEANALCESKSVNLARILNCLFGIVGRKCFSALNLAQPDTAKVGQSYLD